MNHSDFIRQMTKELAAKAGSELPCNFGCVQCSERDWPEDFSHENGQYMCECVHCKKTFIGHKRRVVCKPCSVTMTRTAEPIKAESDR